MIDSPQICGGQAHPSAPPLSLRSSFAWALAGNLVYAASQLGMVVALARLSTPFMIGQFSLGLAIATPVLMFSNLQLRAVLASDAHQRYRFPEYLGLRTVTTLTAILAIALFAAVGTHQPRTAVAILAMGIAKATESMSDVFYGLFQLNDQLDQVGKSMILKGVTSLIAFSSGLYLGGLYFGKDVIWGIAGLIVAWASLLIFFDARRALRFLPSSSPVWLALRPRYSFARGKELARLALPLGIVTTLVALNLHMPRYFVQSYLGETNLGIFSAIAYSTVALTMVAEAMGHAAIPKLSRLNAAGDVAAFRFLMLRLTLFSLVLGLAGIAVVKAIGPQLLAMVFGHEYAAYSRLFTWLMLAGAFTCVASILTVGMTAARVFRIQVPMFAIVAGSNALACGVLIPRMGVEGAAIAPVVASMVHVILAGAAVAYVVKQRRTAVSSYSARWEPGV